jgi:outer membrane protein W
MSFAALALMIMSLPAAAQDQPRRFVGALTGISLLSPDARSITDASNAASSLYDPELGLAVNVFAGLHLAQYFSVQANWMWNRNDLRLFSSYLTAECSGFYEQRRQSSQQAAVVDGLIYFRRLDSIVRPYLGTGVAFMHFSSGDPESAFERGLTAPGGTIESNRVGLRSHVGIDLRLSPRIAFRYSFSETISGNPISPALMPPGERGLMNFQNLFGLVSRF